MKKGIVAMIVVAVLVVSIVGGYLILQDTQEDKVYKVGVLWTAGDPLGGILVAFKEKMTELGYVENETITYDVYKAPQPVGNEEAVQNFVDDEVDLIFSFATEATVEAKAVAEESGIPVVFTCTFIEGTGLVDSVSNPGGNITGVRYPTTESAIGRLEYLHEIAPEVTRIWVPYLNGYPTTSPQIEAIQPIASGLGLTLTTSPFDTPSEVEDYLDERAASDDIGMDAILFLAEPFSVTPEVFTEVYAFAGAHDLPIASFMVFNDAYGPLLGFHPTDFTMGSLAAIHVDKVLTGTQAGIIPVYTSDNSLRINCRVAQELGLTVPESLLGMADEIIY